MVMTRDKRVKRRREILTLSLGFCLSPAPFLLTSPIILMQNQNYEALPYTNHQVDLTLKPSSPPESNTTKEMPRKPVRRCHLARPRPLTCSPFARNVARVASAYKAKRQMIVSKSHEDSLPSSSDKGSDKHSLEENDEQPESSEDEEFDGVVQADFAFFDPKPADFHGVKTLLQTYLDDEQWDISGFVDLILPQTTVGTVVKIEDSEDDGLFAVVTTLNLERYKDDESIKEFKEFILKVCKDKDVKEDLRTLLGAQAQNVGLLVSQRVVNLPPQLLPPLYDSLFDEISWATEDEPTEELRKSFRFKYYLIVSKIYKLKNTGQKKKKGKDDEEEVIYIKPEDEIFHKLCSWSFIYPSSIQQPTDNELKNYQLTGLVMAVEADKIPKFRKELHCLISET